MGTYALRNAVLEPGGSAGGSGWRGGCDSFSRDGFRGSIAQNPALSPDGDAGATQQITGARDGPVVLAGHSYGRAVITEAGTHPDVANRNEKRVRP